MVELGEETFVPRRDYGSCTFADRLAAMGMVPAPIEYYTEYIPLDLMMVSIEL